MARSVLISALVVSTLSVTTGCGSTSSGADGSTLDGGGPDGGGGGAWSVVDGLLQYDVGNGTGEINVRWDRPRTYTDTSIYADPKTFRLYVGSSAGGSQILSGVDLSTTPQKGATHLRVMGLTTGSTYYVRVRAVSSVGNESADSAEASFVATAAPLPPASWAGDISATTTISASGAYRLTADFTGTVTINASGVLLHGQDHTLTHSAAGVVLATGVSSVELRNIRFNPTGSGRNVQIDGALGAGCSLHHSALRLVSDGARMIGAATSGMRDLGGMRIYANTVEILASTSGVCACLAECNNFRAYGNVITSNHVDGDVNRSRSSFLGECEHEEDWGNTFTLLAGLGNTYNSGYTNSDRYSHDNAFFMNGGTDPRLYLTDGGDDLVVLHNTVQMSTTPQGNYRFIRVRAADIRSGDRCIVGFNTVDLRNNGGNTFCEIGDSSSGGGIYQPLNTYLFGNRCNNVAAGDRPLAFYGGTGFQVIYSWDNVFGGQQGSAAGGAWYMNRDSLANGVQDSTSAWHQFDSAIGGSQGAIVTETAWTGFNPATRTPSAPTNVREL